MIHLVLNYKGILVYQNGGAIFIYIDQLIFKTTAAKLHHKTISVYIDLSLKRNHDLFNRWSNCFHYGNDYGDKYVIACIYCSTTCKPTSANIFLLVCLYYYSWLRFVRLVVILGFTVEDWLPTQNVIQFLHGLSGRIIHQSIDLSLCYNNRLHLTSVDIYRQ